MMKRKLFFFFLLALAQLTVPLYMAYHWEDIRQTGHAYLWETQPIDPYDAFRGRYVELGFKEAKGPIADGEEIKFGQTAYASISVNREGYAYIESIAIHKPDQGDYVQVKVIQLEDGRARVLLPFRRFYMTEDLAPLAETAYRKSGRQNSHILVKIKDGLGVVDQLYIGDQTIYEYLTMQNK